MNTFLIAFIGFSFISEGITYGYDAGSDQGACGKPVRINRAMHKPPCDLAKEAYCVSAGSTYPWHAVKRFIRENQGLIRRMYGDEKHLAVLKAELDNDVNLDYDDILRGEDAFAPHPVLYDGMNDDLLRNGDYKTRYSRKDNWLFDDNELFDEGRYIQHAQFQSEDKEEIILNTKFVYSQEPGMQIKLREVLQAPKFTQKHQNTQQSEIAGEVDIKFREPMNETKSDSVAQPPLIDNRINDTKTLNNTAVNANLTAEEMGLGYQDEQQATLAVPSTTEPNSHDPKNESEVKNNSADDNYTTSSQPPVEVYEVKATVQPNVDAHATSTEKKQVSEILFQDFQDDKSKPPHKDFHYNHKLRGVNACPVVEEVVAPFWANNTRGEVLALLNLYPFEQYIHSEKCTYEHRQMYCREGCRCEQQYRLHRLLAYDPNNECRGIFSDWFRFPSCCVCKCYDMPAEFRVTSRSPRLQKYGFGQDENGYDTRHKHEHERPNTWFIKKKLNVKRFN